MQVNLTDFAKAVGLTRPRISQLKKDGKVEVGPDGLLDLHREARRIGRDVDETQLPPPVESREQFRIEVETGNSGEPIDFSYYRSLKMREEALLAQREREIVDGALLKRETVMNELGSAFHACKTRLLTIPTSIAGIVAPETNANICKEIIESAIREALVELQSSATFLGTAESDETSASAFG